MSEEQLCQFVINALEDSKAKEIKVLHVAQLTQITDYMIICSGTSSVHVKSIASNVVAKAKQEGSTIIGVEGDDVGEWVLVDLGDVVVHVMLPRVREFYQLEKLWDIKLDKVTHEN